MLTVTIYDSPGDDNPTEHTDVDYVSLVSNETYGPPALVAPARGRDGHASPRATVGERVLYINTGLVPVFEIERTSD